FTVPHTLWYRYTAVTSGGTFPEFTVVGLVDGEQFVYYDSNIRKMIPKTEWIKKIGTSYPQYWEQETQRMQDQQARFQNSMNIAMQSFRHTAGVHTLQRMYGCELYDNGTKRGHDQFGYDGEDLISLDMSSQTWTEASIRARTFMNKWGSLGINPKFQKSYLEMECISWLKQYLGYSRDTLERKVRPEASFFQRDPSSPEVVCHATGFYPNPVDISWQKDGQVVHENVLLGETLPNGDGTFQKRIVLKVSAEELQKHNYTCVIQHSSLEK
ncbi:major histocompatibility complex class I UXA2 precursor, partial [Silurus meridionalis]